MILYFSGTGNSEYAARRIGKATGDEVISLFDKIKNSDFSEMQSENPWVVVTPTYAWRIPHIVRDWLKNTAFSGSRDIYFVMTCGGNIGNAGEYLKKLCAEKNLNYRGCAEIVMPENYIAMFSTMNEKEASAFIDKSESAIDSAALCVKMGERLPEARISLMDKIYSGIVNDAFYPMFVHAKKFYATDDCISCGKCADVCPLSNIGLENGKPKWGDKCTHCMACINRCPKEAIEYGKHSNGQPRYTCPKKADK